MPCGQPDPGRPMFLIFQIVSLNFIRGGMRGGAGWCRNMKTQRKHEVLILKQYIVVDTWCILLIQCKCHECNNNNMMPNKMKQIYIKMCNKNSMIRGTMFKTSITN
jgi:hypothetical protein